MSRLLRERTLWLGAGLWAAAIFVVSSIPRREGMVVPLPGEGIDKPLHLIAYLILAGLVGLALRARGKGRALAAVLSLAMAAAYGSLDEWHQSWVPGRVASWQDWVADLAGACIGALAVAAAPGFNDTEDERGETADSADQ